MPAALALATSTAEADSVTGPVFGWKLVALPVGVAHMA